MNIRTLVALSHHYGKNPNYVLGGGGNTSWKDKDTLYVKASGSALAEVEDSSFVKMDRALLAAIWKKTYPDSNTERESAVLADMMAARKSGEEQKRPSVEALLHDLLPYSYVVHLHPALVNGLTCSMRGEEAMAEIFEDKAIWIPSTNPGYILSGTVKAAMDSYKVKHGKNSAIIFLQNHGVFVGDNSADGIKEIYGEIMDKIGAWIKRRPDFSGEKRLSHGAAQPVEEMCKTLSELAGEAIFMQAHEIPNLLRDRSSFAPVSSAFTPDHIVYAGSSPLFTEQQSPGGVKEAWKIHVEKTRINPKIVAVQDLGIFGLGSNQKMANLALDLFKDAIKVAIYSESFGGPRFMTQDKIDFINNWEAERFRTNISAK